MIRAILFDLDDTLYARAPIVAEWARRFAAAHLCFLGDDGRQAAEQTLITLDGRGYVPKAGVLSGIKGHFPIVRMDTEAFITEFFDCFFGLISLDAPTSRLLAALQGKGLPFGIVTNGSVRQRPKIQRLGLERSTSCIFVSEEFGCKKPDQSIFLAAAANLSVAPPDILFVGDNPALDIGGAKNVGMQTAWIHRGQPWPEELADLRPDFTVGLLDELIPVFA